MVLYCAKRDDYTRSRISQYRPAGVVRQNADMPRLTTPAEMPQEVLAIIDVIGNHVRTEILRRLCTAPATAVDLASEMGVAHSSVHRNLLRLEEYGLVVADVEPGRRVGNKVVRWAAVPEKVEGLGRRWIEYATGS